MECPPFGCRDLVPSSHITASFRHSSCCISSAPPPKHHWPLPVVLCPAPNRAAPTSSQSPPVAPQPLCHLLVPCPARRWPQSRCTHHIATITLPCLPPLIKPYVPPCSALPSPPLASVALRRRDRFDSAEAARKLLQSKPPFSTFDEEVVRLYVQHGLSPTQGRMRAARATPFLGLRRNLASALQAARVWSCGVATVKLFFHWISSPASSRPRLPSHIHALACAAGGDGVELRCRREVEAEVYSTLEPPPALDYGKVRYHL